MDNRMNSLLSVLSCYLRLPRGGPCRKSPARGGTGHIRQRTRLFLETLEERALLSGVSLSVADATIKEIGNVSAFVASGSGGLSAPKDLVLGPDRNLYVASSGSNSIIRYSAAGNI